MKLLAFVTVSSTLLTINLAFRNNVCKTWWEYFIKDLSNNCYFDINAESDTPSIILRHGFKFENYGILTTDGYLLSLFRIPGDGIPVILVHTILTSSVSFVSLKNDSLAFLLAKEGYDVYLLNVRGTRYSLDHKTYKTSESKYWNTAIDDIARYDLEAAFTKIKELSGRRKLLYVGHNSGATYLLAYGALFPNKIQENVAGAVLIAPQAEMRNSGLLFTKIAGRHAAGLWKFLQITGLDKILSYYKYQKILLKIISKSPALLFVYVRGEQLKYGRDSVLTPEVAPYFLNAIFEGGSIKIILNIDQYRVKPFSTFDYGKEGNLEKYGQQEPLPYNYSAIEIPLYLVYSAADKYENKKDVYLLYEKLSEKAKTLGKLEIKEPGFTDFGFILGKNAKHLVYDSIIQKLAVLAKNEMEVSDDGNGGDLEKENGLDGPQERADSLNCRVKRSHSFKKPKASDVSKEIGSQKSNIEPGEVVENANENDVINRKKSEETISEAIKKFRKD